ncbi:hypothetical protein B0H03_10476 [Rathayibacter iranicus NCPPB 2253 = VKM Ac-1602]|uniref:Uncharacterized protein n=1 Tax=Rathayibacter iranicus NCPPB 2253 = VKM Ac-1602 TaxID=1328868 RepID=A0ABX5LHD6_9MICO|nr:hypothetical protein B0H03_10476 [Rathayibacter iranicus NCPPB 2253 = VKM Ac-1602]
MTPGSDAREVHRLVNDVRRAARSSEEGATRRHTPSEGNNPNIALTRPQHTRLLTLVGG